MARAQAVGAHHRDVGPRDRQDAGRSPRRRGDRADARCADRRRAAAGGSAGTGRGARAPPIGPDAGAAAAVRDAERLVQVEVRDVGAELARAWRQPTSALRLAPSRYTWPPCSCTTAQMSRDVLLEHAVGRRVGDHQRGEVGRRAASALRLRSSRSTLPSSSHFTTTTRMPAIDGAGRVGAVRRRGIRHTSRCVARRGCVVARGSRAGRRTRPASPRWAAATPRRSR